MAEGHPGYGQGQNDVSGERESNKVSGTPTSSDATLEPGQYPPGGWGNSIFGGTLPSGTGAPGSQGATFGPGTDATNQPGQTQDGLTGISEHDIVSTGAPGSPGAQFDGDNSGDAVSFTEPGSYLSGTYESEIIKDELTGPQDWTQANDDGYATGGPQLPGIGGNEPQAGSGRYQPGAGRVMRGGRMVRG